VPAPQEIDGRLGRFKFIASTLIHREVFERLGGFPEDLRSAEDLLWMRKVIASEFAIAYAPDAVVHWQLQPNLWRTFKRFAKYARNNIRAGLWREWQRAIFMRYAFFVLVAIPAVFFGWWWLAAPLGLWVGFMLARATNSIDRNRAKYSAGAGRNVARGLLLVPILATIDAAAFVGSVDWLLRVSFDRDKKVDQP
jgi:hypothetical protein